MNFRLDRLCTLYLVHPLKRHVAPGRLRVPILMYHSISDEDERHLHPYYRTVTAPAVFREHMRVLHANGYRTVSLNEAVCRMTEPGMPEKPVVITFDDGYADFQYGALPILKEFGFSAMIFLATAYIGKTAQMFRQKYCLTWNQVRELRQAGIYFGSHTITHRHLDLLPADELKLELTGSKQTIEDKLGCAADSFAYPFAFPEAKAGFKQSIRDLLGKAGYKQGVSTTIGVADHLGDRMFMKRLPVNSCDDPPLLLAKLSGAYDWLRKPQYAFKMLKRLTSPTDK
jgi:peptidoglycan/xylan/chitin deacetylase (PgdA/CDA1 family)